MTRARLQRLIAVLSCVLGTSSCERHERMHADQQIALIDRCEQARNESLAAPESEREAAISRWAAAVQDAKGLCRNDPQVVFAD